MAGLKAFGQATALCLAPGLLGRAALLLLVLCSAWLGLAWWGWEPATDASRALLATLGWLAPAQAWLLRWEQAGLLTVLGPLVVLLLAWPLAWLALWALLGWLWLPGLRRRCGLQGRAQAGLPGPSFGPPAPMAGPRRFSVMALSLALLLACTALPLHALLWWPWRRAWLLWGLLAPVWGLGVLTLLARCLPPPAAAGPQQQHLPLLRWTAWPLWLAAAPLGWLALGPLSPWTAGPPALVLAPLLGLWALALQAALLMWAAAWCVQWVSLGPVAAPVAASVPMAPAQGPAP